MDLTPKFYRIPKSLLAAVVLLVTIALAGSVAESTGVPKPRVLDTYGKLPVSFEVN